MRLTGHKEKTPDRKESRGLKVDRLGGLYC